MFRKPVKGKKASTVSCRRAVTKTCKDAEIVSCVRATPQHPKTADIVEKSYLDANPDTSIERAKVTEVRSKIASVGSVRLFESSVVNSDKDIESITIDGLFEGFTIRREK